MKKKLIIILIILLIILIGLGIYSYTTSSLKINNTDNTNNTKVEEQDETSSIPRETNDSKKITKEHCLDNFCVKDMKIVNEYDEYFSVTGTAYNKSNEAISKGLVKFVFNVDGEEKSILFYHDDMDANFSYDLEMHDNYKELVDADDYTIVKPSETEEKEFYENNLID
jgi:uncharacterized protein YxeA